MSPRHIDGYLRFPSISGDLVVFVTEDDLWSVPAGGGPARRLTADLLGLARPVLSADGALVAFTGEAQGQPDVYVVPSAGGPVTRLTWLGTASSRPTGFGGQTKVLAWAPDGRVVYATDAGQPFSSLTMAYAALPDGTQPAAPLPYGPVRDASYGPGGGVVVGRNTGDPALWKRYRGGTAGSLWLDEHGTGEFRLLMRSADINGNIGSPLWLGDRIYFLSDHEGVGNLYSCTLAADDVRRHTDHQEHYARNASSDGRAVVYQMAGEIWRFDPLADRSAQLDIELGSPRTQRQPRFVPADANLTGYQLDQAGTRALVETRGKVFAMAPFDGPATQVGLRQGPRYRLPRFLGPTQDIVVVSDASGGDALEVHLAGAEVGAPARALEAARLGRPVQLVPSPDGSSLAVTDHEHRLLVVDVATGAGRVVDASPYGPVADPAWSADGKWLAYSYRSSLQTSQIRLADVPGGTTHEVTRPQFRDFGPSFDPTGQYLYFLSRRTFDPVYDGIFLDLGFPLGVRPYLVTLSADRPSPFVCPPGPPTSAPSSAAGSASGGDGAGAVGAAGPPEGREATGPAVPPVLIDIQGIEDRVVEVPVPEGRYEQVVALDNKVLLLSRPSVGALSTDWSAAESPPNGTLECYDLVERRAETYADQVVDVVVSGDRSHMAYRFGGGDALRLRVVPTSARPDPDSVKDGPGRRSGLVDLGRARPLVDPGTEWAQMVREAWRLQPEHFWTADLSGVDWALVLERYLPLVDKVATRTEVSDLIWEIQGELGTSHCYELGGEYRPAPSWAQAHLGADLAPDGEGRWVVARVVAVPSWKPDEASPLSTPGANIVAGTAVLAVNGQPVDAAHGPAPLLANQAGQVVELTVVGPGAEGAPAPLVRRVVVPTLANERPLRYQAWVNANRDWVHEATGGRAGYVHVPDMMPRGWSQFHRLYLSEMERGALVVDARFNGGGHISALVLEKLARKVIGWAVPRRGAPEPYPAEAPLGPIVALVNEWAGSDGDIFTQGFKLLGLGPVVGARTWGGVIGIDPFQRLVDGALTTQPHVAFWFTDAGWAVENYGSDPTEEVLVTPQDYAAGRDPQLARAVELALGAVAGHHAPRPDLDARPRRPLPVLPAR